MGLQKFCVKFFARPSPGFDDTPLIAVFHDWIRRGAPLGTLIDVADYRHVPGGPGVMLIGHEGNFSLDRGQGRPGLMYQRKAASPGDAGRRLQEATRQALLACRLLGRDPRLGGDLAFSTGELHFTSNDRLLAPNTDEAYGRLEQDLQALGRCLYGEFALRRESNDPRERLAARLSCGSPPDIEVLLDRL